ncbi:hypothetical protein ACA910_018851 [Epithemia clementina (nom. ined.)]
MSVVGVDLGYQNSVIAVAGRGGVDVILNGNSNRLNPSMVGFSECRQVGEHATSGVISNFRNTIRGMKRLIGLPFDSPAAKAEMAHYPGISFVPHSKGDNVATIAVDVEIGGESRVLPVEHIEGMMIHHMGMIAAQKAAQESQTADVKSLFPQDWVVTIPSYYTDVQRRALLAGCEMVGITSVQRLMHENTATALAYGIFKDLKKEFKAEEPTKVMFIDMGASAFTVSIASFEPGKLKMLASHSDLELGGREFDMAIANWVAGKFEEKYGKKLSSKPMETPKTRLKILAAAEKAKKTLSPQGVKEASINLEMLQDEFDFHVTLKADEYEKVCKPLLDRLAAPIAKCLAEAKIESASKDLSVVEIVGGSSRIGMVKRKLMSILNVSSLSTTMNADEAVARGAALQSAILSPRFKVLPYDIQEAQPYPIEVSWGTSEDDSVVMFDRGLSFPVTRRVTLKNKVGPFSVQASYKTPEAVNDWGLDPSLAKESIVTFHIQPPKETPSSDSKIRVNVKQDIHGTITLSSAQLVEEVEEEENKDAAAELKEGEAGEDAPKTKKKVTKTSLEFTVSRRCDWTKEEIDKYHEIEVAMANTDRVVRETADMRNELESYIYDMRDKVMSDSGLAPYGTEKEKGAFTKKNEEMENWLYGDEGFNATKKVFAEKLAQLKKLGGPIEYRQAESVGRPTAQANLQAALELYQNWVNSEAASLEHITEEDRQKVRKTCDEISAWMYEQMDKQGDLPVNVDPVLTIEKLNTKLMELKRECGPIMAKKPAPKAPTPPASTNKSESSSSKDTPDGTGTPEDPMQVDEKEGEEGKDGTKKDAMEVD